LLAHLITLSSENVVPFLAAPAQVRAESCFLK
jgi:hypothetical protein